MAQFQIKTSNDKRLFPCEMDIYDRKKLYNECQKGLHLFCNCNGKIEYKIRDGSQSSRWDIYPCSQGKQMEHEDWCPKSKKYMAKRDYNKGFSFDDDTCEVHVHLSEPLTHRERYELEENEIDDNDQVNHYVDRKQYPSQQQGRVSISAMIKNLNMLTFKHVAFSAYESDYPPTNVMVKKLYWALKRTKIGRRKCIADLKRKIDNIEFVYKELMQMPQFDGTNRITRLRTREKNQNGEVVEIPVYTEELVRALGEYEDTYFTNDISERKILLAGFRDKYAMYSLRFLLVNDYGLFSESYYEVQMYNAVCKIMNENKFKAKGVYFYKPFEYGFGAYEDKYLEDGIIEFDKTNKKIIIEVYGRNDESYLMRKQIKSQILASKKIFTLIFLGKHITMNLYHIKRYVKLLEKY